MPKKVDANQKDIVSALRTAGCEVQHLSDVGKGCPDILVAFRGNWFVAELKSEKGTLEASQIVWHQKFGRCAKVCIWRSVEEAVREIGGCSPMLKGD